MINPKVSDHMDLIIEYIGKLIAANVGYFVGEDVYFDTKQIKNYGQLSKQDVNKNIAGYRVQAKEQKRSPTILFYEKTNVGITWQTPWE